MNRVRMPDGTLNHFTAASGVEIYRGHRLPQDMVGDLFFGEPVGRIVRRAKVVVRDGLTQLQNAYPKSEFLRSTDPLFRPVAVHNAPDGSLIVVDMYTGIIQDAQFVGPNSYLRRKVEQYKLDAQHNLGRIWKITYEGTPPDRQRPRMYSETPAQLVKHLEHANGWWRDTAQKLLVLKQDKTRGAGAADSGAEQRQSAGADSCALDAGRPRRARCGPRPRADEEPGSADQDSGHQGQRDAVQGEGLLVCRGLQGDDGGPRSQRRHPGDVDPQPPQDSRRRQDDPRRVAATTRARRARDRHADPEAADVARAAAVARRYDRQRLQLLDRSTPRAASRRGRLQGDLRRVPCSGRRRRADGRRARRHAARAAARRFGARDRTSRLRDQGAAARPHRPARRQGVPGRRDGADGYQHR